jgi:hypothetical protein
VFALDRNHELDLVRALLILEIAGLFADELLKRFQGEPAGIFSGSFLRAAQRFVEGFDFFLFVVGILAGNRNDQRPREVRFGFGSVLLFAQILDLPRSRAKMPLNGAFLLLLHPFAEDFAILRVHLGQIAVAEALRKIHLRAAVAVALHRGIDAPFEIRRGPLFAAAEVLFVLDFQLADVLLQLVHVFFGGFSHIGSVANIDAKCSRANGQRGA